MSVISKVVAVATTVGFVAAQPYYYVDPATPDLPGRSIVWSDEFNGDSVDSNRWNYEILAKGAFNNELQHYTDSATNSFIEDGKLVIRVVQEGDQEYSSARMRSNAYHTYGHWEINASLPTFDGSWPAIWQLPEVVNWPLCGEMDIMEHTACDMNDVLSTIHTGSYNHILGTQKQGRSIVPVDEFHVYKLTWTPTQMILAIDDDAAHFTFDNENTRTEANWPYFKPMNVILNIAVGGSLGAQCAAGTNPQVVDDGTTNVMKIDFVRVYSFEGDVNNLDADCDIGGSTWNADADGQTCGDRIDALVQSGAASGWHAAKQTVGTSFPTVCGACQTPVCEAGGTVWETLTTDGATCGDRITYLVDQAGKSTDTAKFQIAGEFPDQCSGCVEAGLCTPGSTVWNTQAGAEGTCGERIIYLIQEMNLLPAVAQSTIAAEFPDICGVCADVDTCSPGGLVWNAAAPGFGAEDATCGSRIDWLVNSQGKTLTDAKVQVAAEFPEICGACALVSAPTAPPTTAAPPTAAPTPGTATTTSAPVTSSTTAAPTLLSNGGEDAEGSADGDNSSEGPSLESTFITTIAVLGAALVLAVFAAVYLATLNAKSKKANSNDLKVRPEL